MKNSALHYASMGYGVFPCVSDSLEVPSSKAPLTKKGVKNATTDIEIIEKWWAKWPTANIGLATDGLCVIDVDGADNAWLQSMGETLRATGCPIAHTPRGGTHFVFRIANDDIKNSVSKIAKNVDVRTSGGYILVSPSSVGGVAYSWENGRELINKNSVPVVPEWIISILKAKEEKKQQKKITIAPIQKNDVTDRAIAYIEAMPIAVQGFGGHNALYAVATTLVHGFELSESESLSIILKYYNPRCDPPWEPNEYRQIVHKIHSAAKNNHDQPRGWLRNAAQPEEIAQFDFSEQEKALKSEAIECKEEEENIIEDEESENEDPGRIPEEMLHIPGFVDDVIDYNLKFSPCPNPVIAFCGAITLQAFLCGRKIKDVSDVRPNLYVVGLSPSGSGKNFPRVTNIKILTELGLLDSYAERFGSAQGIEDALAISPNLLIQTDEIETIFSSFVQRDTRSEFIMAMLLELYSSSNTAKTSRLKAGKERLAPIDQPHLTLFGTSVPDLYYKALNEKMLTNGLISRLLIFDYPDIPMGNTTHLEPIPEKIMAIANFWNTYTPPVYDFSTLGSPQSQAQQTIIDYTADALDCRDSWCKKIWEYRNNANKKGDSIATTLWGRTQENALKLALIRSISESPEDPKISLSGIEWAFKLTELMTKRTLYMAASHTSESDFQSDCQKVIRILKKSPKKSLPHNELYRKIRKLSAKDFRGVIEALLEQAYITQSRVGHGKAGRPTTIYHAK